MPSPTRGGRTRPPPPGGGRASWRRSWPSCSSWPHGVLFAQGRALRDTPATANRALSDSEATTRVAGDVSNALGKVFSYSPQATAVTKESAKQLLAGKALQQYAALFGQVEKQAADQKLTLTTHVVRAGVTRLTENSAHLLVFLDQVYEREGVYHHRRRPALRHRPTAGRSLDRGRDHLQIAVPTHAQLGTDRPTGERQQWHGYGSRGTR